MYDWLEFRAIALPWAPGFAWKQVAANNIVKSLVERILDASPLSSTLDLAASRKWTPSRFAGPEAWYNASPVCRSMTLFVSLRAIPYGKGLTAREAPGPSASLVIRCRALAGMGTRCQTPIFTYYARAALSRCRDCRTRATRLASQIRHRVTFPRDMGVRDGGRSGDTSRAGNRVVPAIGNGIEPHYPDLSPNFAARLDSDLHPLVWRWRYCRDLPHLSGFISSSHCHGNECGGRHPASSHSGRTKFRTEPAATDVPRALPRGGSPIDYRSPHYAGHRLASCGGRGYDRGQLRTGF